MTELRRLWLPGPAGRIEAVLRASCPAHGSVVVAHPHPQYGGTLHNPVVFHADRELHRAGYTTLRFNFRGVGASEGSYDQGRGEVEDVAAAAAWLRGLAGGPMLLVGFSFGSYCASRYMLEDENVRALVCIGLPLAAYSFEHLKLLRRPYAVVQGTDDEYGSPDMLRPLLASTSPPGSLHEIQDAPHPFPQRAREVGQTVVRAVAELLAVGAGG